MPKRKKLAGLPTEHAKLAKGASSIAEVYAHETRRMLRQHDCGAAYKELLGLVKTVELAEEHAHSSEGRESVPRAVLSARDTLVMQFKSSCVRKPGFLDRFKRRKD